MGQLLNVARSSVEDIVWISSASSKLLKKHLRLRNGRSIDATGTRFLSKFSGIDRDGKEWPVVYENTLDAVHCGIYIIYHKAVGAIKSILSSAI